MPNIVVSPEQHSHRLLEAQELLHRIQSVLVESDNPSFDIITEVLTRSEQYINQLSQTPELDSETRKILEDLSALLITARSMGKNKGFADRLQRIAQESQKAIEANRGKDMSVLSKEARSDIMEFITNWRPLFQLLLSSPDFRELLLDSVKIAKRIVYRFTKDLTDDMTDKFNKGVSATKIAREAKEEFQYMETPEMSDEEWEVLQDDIQKVLIILVKEPTYRQGVERIFILLDKFQSKMQTEDNLGDKIYPEEKHVQNVVKETEELVASFSGREELDQFKDNLRILITRIQKNVSLQIYLTELKIFILKAKSEDEIRTEEFRSETRKIVMRGRRVMNELTNDDHLEPFFRAADEMVQNIKNDEFLQILRHQAGILQTDLSYVDSEGQIQVDTDMLSKLQSVLLPVLADALKYIPVPRVHSVSSNQEFWLDNIVLCSYDIIPENIKFHLETDSEVSLRDIQLKSSHTNLVIQLDRLLAELKDVEFYFKKKSFPEIEDSGRVTFREKGKGARLTLTYNILQGPDDVVPRIMEGYANFYISDMEIAFDKGTLKHSVLIPMFTKIFKAQIKTQIERAVEKNLAGFIKKLGKLMSKAMLKTNKPFLSGIEAARKAVKSSQVAQVYEKRREKLE
jgi:hypothetical protein